ncbi:unnamed protein product [Schistosoma margrebowiei]|uniref:Uncharacterized protein n=1 Tax=Schistosoma margrebowiei TaxID=48269 RepID=A0AA84ZBT0_9TREM|nr:unnamed protein product [Schistosoma margrebowiei]
MKACLMQAAVIFIYYLGVQNVMTADIESVELKVHVVELLAYVFRYDDKPFRDEVMRLEKLYAAKWIYDLFKNINPNDANLLQTYSAYSLIESAIKKKWNARLYFDLATNIYLNMKTSSKSSSLTENNVRVINIYQEVLETGQSFKKVYIKEMQENIDEMAEQLEIETQNLKATEAEAKNTLNSNDRKHLEHFAEDIKQKIDDYKANPEIIAAKDNNQHAAMKYFSALDNHLKTLKIMEVQRIDVLELLPLEERIKIYESIMQEERNQKNERNFNKTKYCSQTVVIKILSTFSLTEKPKNSINVHFIQVSFH